MSEAQLENLTRSQRELLAIASKTNVLTEEMLNCPEFSETGTKDFNRILKSGIISAEKKTDGFHINFNYDLKSQLHLDFMEIPSDRRLSICRSIADQHFEKTKILEGLKVLNDSGNKRVFTDAILENTIQIQSRNAAEALIELSNSMLRENTLEDFAHKTFRITAFIWLGEYLQAHELLDELESEIKSGKYEEHFGSAALLLRAYVNLYMGRPITGFKDISLFIDSLKEKPWIQDSAVILGCRLYASIALGTHDFDSAKSALEIAKEKVATEEGNAPYFQYQLLQIEACKLFVEGRLKLAYEKAVTAIDIALRENYSGIQGPLESLYIKASCEEEFLNHLEAINTWQNLLSISDEFHLPTWHCVATLRLARCKFFLDPKIDLINELKSARNYYETLPYRHELDLVVDIEELFIAYRLHNLERAKTLINRIPKNARTEEMSIAISVMLGSVPRKSEIASNTVREKILFNLVLANQPNLSDEKLKEITIQLLNLAEENGWQRILCIQPAKLTSMLVRISSEGANAFQEQIVRLISEITENRYGQPVGKRVVLTAREREVLLLLATGYGREEICAQLSLSLNTLKTHQKNIYKKLGVKSRQSAVINAKKLGLLTQ